MSEQPDSLNDARPRLFNHFNQVEDAQHVQKWDELWKEGFAPWDRGVPNPALVDLLNERQDLFEAPPKRRKRKALVPGCGRGYDVLLFAAYGYDAYGLEFSGKALENARKVEKEFNGKGDYETKAGVERGSVTWLEGDFFKDGALKDVEGGGTFDIVYDYTVCSPKALPVFKADSSVVPISITTYHAAGLVETYERSCCP
jgi:SAM-dependent methyltransferase